MGDYHIGAMRCYLAAGDKSKAREHMSILRANYAGTNLIERANREAAEGGLY